MSATTSMTQKCQDIDDLKGRLCQDIDDPDEKLIGFRRSMDIQMCPPSRHQDRLVKSVGW